MILFEHNNEKIDLEKEFRTYNSENSICVVCGKNETKGNNKRMIGGVLLPWSAKARNNNRYVHYLCLNQKKQEEWDNTFEK